jgi:glutamate N-acetyltransferase/amino-acid N-acetyltransferase
MVAPYDQKAAVQAVSGPEVRLLLDLHDGTEEAAMWTCDLTTEYVKINAEYHT